MTLPFLIVFNENLGIVVQYIQSVRDVTNMKRINHFQDGSIPVLHDGVKHFFTHFFSLYLQGPVLIKMCPLVERVS